MRGPIDFIVVQFPGNKFKGEILKELSEAIGTGAVAILDLSLISKDEEGNIMAMELSDGDSFHEMLPAGPTAVGLITPEDVEEVGELLDNNSSAGLLVIEQLWAKGLKKDIIDADGKLVADGRIHPDASDALNSTEV
jgi:hypothetical protein